MNMDDGMRGRMAGALAIFTKRHVVAPAQSYTQSPVYNAVTGHVSGKRTNHELTAEM